MTRHAQHQDTGADSDGMGEAAGQDLPAVSTGANRYRRAREQAGLSLAQAERMTGIGRVTLQNFENGVLQLEVDVTKTLADVYGCSIAWLRGDHVEPPAELVKMLRDSNVSFHDRDIILEFAASIQGRPLQPGAKERLSAARARRERSPKADQPTARKVRYVKSQAQTRKHHCHWPGCDKQVPPAMWGCKAHWFRLPKALRDRIWRAYAPGQEVDLTPSDEYLQVADDVQRWIQENGATP